MYNKKTRRVARWLVLLFFCAPSLAAQQLAANPETASNGANQKTTSFDSIEIPAITSTISRYVDLAQGVSASDLIRRAMQANQELQAVRLDIERARARLSQAKLRPNPSVDFEQTSGSLTGSRGEKETAISFSLPLEIGGKRQRRIDLAQTEIAIAEAAIGERERLLTKEIRMAYAEALAFVRELQLTENLQAVDTQSARIIEARVTEGDSSPLELNLLRVEVDRLKSRRTLLEGRLQGAILKLKSLAGISSGEILKLREDLTTTLSEPVASVEEAIILGLRQRPDLQFARLVEEAALAGFKLASAQSLPEITVVSKYTYGRTVFDNTPLGTLRDRDKLLTFGVSINLPVFNRHQGAKAEAEIAIEQARCRREFVEAAARSEIASAYARYDAARNALAIFEKGVIERSTQNLISVRKAYELGAFNISELLTEQRKFLDSQREFIETLAERYRALADIESATGLIRGNQ
jgi:outer membrane protein, heavy metal efflux system